MVLFGIIVYCTVFALAYAWAAVWMLERKEKKYRQGSSSFTDAFLVGAFILVFVYFSNMVVMMRWTDAAFTYDLALLAGLAAFAIYKEVLYRARDNYASRRMRAEARLLERYMLKDPGNAAYFERASELYEKLGDREKAIEAARMAAKLDPTVRNTWRFKELMGEDPCSAGGKGRSDTP